MKWGRWWTRSPAAVAGIGLVVAVLAVVAATVLAADGGGIGAAAGRSAGPSAGESRGADPVGEVPRRLAPDELPKAVGRTIAGRSARLEATYTPPSGPPVTITGHLSFVGPESDIAAAVIGEPPAAVRVTADGAWLRPPGAHEWTPVSMAEVSGAAAARGWSDLLSTLRGSDAVWVDGGGRIVRVRRGSSLDLRFSDFGVGVGVAHVPP
jgi:hypothetical protein